MDMYYSKKAEALRKRQLKLNKEQQFAESNSALVRLLVPPASHRDELSLMPEHELAKLKPVELVKQASLLMTASDPHVVAACGGATAVDQCILAVAALTTRANRRLIEKLLHDKADELKAVADVNSYMKITRARMMTTRIMMMMRTATVSLPTKPTAKSVTIQKTMWKLSILLTLRRRLVCHQRCRR